MREVTQRQSHSSNSHVSCVSSAVTGTGNAKLNETTSRGEEGERLLSGRFTPSISNTILAKLFPPNFLWLDRRSQRDGQDRRESSQQNVMLLHKAHQSSKKVICVSYSNRGNFFTQGNILASPLWRHFLSWEDTGKCQFVFHKHTRHASARAFARAAGTLFYEATLWLTPSSEGRNACGRVA